jgi:hypothetical protein
MKVKDVCRPSIKAYTIGNFSCLTFNDVYYPKKSSYDDAAVSRPFGRVEKGRQQHCADQA